jgi:hypothetical protein
MRADPVPKILADRSKPRWDERLAANCRGERRGGVWSWVRLQSLARAPVVVMAPALDAAARVNYGRAERRRGELWRAGRPPVWGEL